MGDFPSDAALFSNYFGQTCYAVVAAFAWRITKCVYNVNHSATFIYCTVEKATQINILTAKNAKYDLCILRGRPEVGLGLIVGKVKEAELCAYKPPKTFE